MLSLTLTCSPVYSKTIKNPITHQNRAFCHLSPQFQSKRQQLSSLDYNPLRVPAMNTKRRGFGAVCYSGPLAPGNLQWISTISTAVLRQFEESV